MLLAPLTAACIAMSAQSYQLPQVYLWAILKAESGRVGQAVHNQNGTDDLGPFQVNSSWGPAIGRYWHIPVPQALERVRDNGCANAVIATAILKKALIETKGDYPKAIGFYHSHTEPLAGPYRNQVLKTAAYYARTYPNLAPNNPNSKLPPQPRYIRNPSKR